MVYFVCNACGESLKKNQVEKHCLKCRSCQSVCCIDCNKDFYGNEYESHIKCISEEEKYSGKNFKPKPNANKGEVKQELWTQQVQEAISKVKTNPKLKNVLVQLEDYPNIPQKKQKFENFLANSLCVRDRRLAAQVWEAISVEFNTQVAAKGSENAANSDPDTMAKAKQSDDSLAEEKHKKNAQQEATPDPEEQTKKKKKKDKKKDKQQSEENGDTRDVTVEEDVANNESREKKSKKHKKKRAELDVEANGTNEHIPSADCGEGSSECLAPPVGTDSTDDGNYRKKSKKNKRKLEELNGESAEETESKSHSSKRIRTEEVEVLNSDAVQSLPGASFKWEAAIIGVLRRASDNQLSLKKLRKKVLSEFNARQGDGKVYTEEKLLAKFTRKVNHCPRLKVHKELVKLVN